MQKIKEKWASFSKRKKVLISVGIFTFLVGIFLLIMYLSVWRWDYIYEDGSYSAYNYNSCDIIGISLKGDVVSYIAAGQQEEDLMSAEDVIYTLEIMDKQKVPAIMLDITSWGGNPAPSKEIADYVAQMKTPVIASIREAGLSGGYYIASQADEIFAAPFSDIGSIGVTMSYLDESKLNQKEGYTWNSLSTGKFKDAGSPDKPLTEEERALFERDLNFMHNIFVADVASGRNMSVDEVKKLADGSSMLSEQAQKSGLIDGVKHQWEVIEYIKDKYKTGDQICWE